MTQNQLQYWRNVETERANKAQESLRGGELQETNRANRAKELETMRSNRAKEAETARSNRVGEAEINRHNLMTEDLTRLGLPAQYLSGAGSILKGMGSLI